MMQFFFACACAGAEVSTWSWNRPKNVTSWEVFVNIHTQESGENATFGLRSTWGEVELTEEENLITFRVLDGAKVTWPSSAPKRQWKHDITGVQVNGTKRDGDWTVELYVQKNDKLVRTATVTSKFDLLGSNLTAFIRAKNQSKPEFASDPLVTINGAKVVVTLDAKELDSGEPSTVSSPKRDTTTLIVFVVACVCGGVIFIFLLVVCYASRCTQSKQRRSVVSRNGDKLPRDMNLDSATDRMKLYFALQRSNTLPLALKQVPSSRKDLRAVRTPQLRR